MQECWVQGNKRAFALALLPAVAAAAAGAMLLAVGLGAFGAEPRAPIAVLGGILAMLGLFWLGPPLLLMSTPRLAYQDGQVLVYLRPARPEALPVESVECFFLGKDEAGVAGGARASTIVVRVAEAAKELRQRTDSTRLGGWREGYIVLAGAWCEPITPELLRKINARLNEVRKERSRQGAAG